MFQLKPAATSWTDISTVEVEPILSIRYFLTADIIKTCTYLSHCLFHECRNLNCTGKADVCVLSVQLGVFDAPSPQTL